MHPMPRKRKPRSTHLIWLADECERIGSGYRGVILDTLGPKWATFHETVSGKRGKLARALWDRRATEKQ